MTDARLQLQELGFGEYEARAYQALLQHHLISGYELAKVSGVPRANIYPVLQKLEERGAAVRVEDGASTRYLPIEPEELLDAMTYRFEQTVQTARQSLQGQKQPDSVTYVWHIEGYDNLLAHARTLIRESTTELLVALWPHEARVLAPDFAQAEARDVEITTLCLAACAEECGGCRGRIFRNNVVETPDARWLMLVPDGEVVLAGEVADSGAVSSVRSRQRLLVNMTSWFIRHSIAVAVMLQEIGGELETQLTPRSRSELAAVGPQGGKDWLAHMRRLLSVRRGASDLQ